MILEKVREKTLILGTLPTKIFSGQRELCLLQRLCLKVREYVDNFFFSYQIFLEEALGFADYS